MQLSNVDIRRREGEKSLAFLALARYIKICLQRNLVRGGAVW
jgi:hypothetical protein